MKYVILSILFLVATSVRGIINGENAKEKQIPYQVLVASILNDCNETTCDYGCGGSIIHKRWILTAAHCLQNTTILAIVAGKVDRNVREGETYEVETKIIHENFTYDGWQALNDIGLIRLKKDIKFNDAIQPIVLAKYRFFDYRNSPAVISGYGQTNRPDSHSENAITPDHLQYANVRVVGNHYKDCIVKRNFTVDYSQICTSIVDNRSICHGDSGGPLVAYDLLIGIASYTDYACGIELPSVFTRVTHFYPWIKEQINLFGDVV